jgi:diguanylate cyclase (GGDEF)-like protein
VSDVTPRGEDADRLERLDADNDALIRVAECAATPSDPAALAELAAGQVAKLFGAVAAGVVRFDDDAGGTVVGWAPAAGPCSLVAGTTVDLAGSDAVSQVWRGGVAARSPDPGMAAPALNERVAVPIVVGGRVWGALTVRSPVMDGLARSVEERLSRFADLVALAISEHEARNELQARVAQQAAVSELSGLALKGDGLDELFQVAVDRVRLLLNVPLATMVEVLADDFAVVSAASGEDTDRYVGLRFHASPDTFTGATLARDAPLIVDDLTTAGPLATTPVIADAGMRVGAGFAIQMADRVWGVLSVFTSRRRSFTGGEIAFLQGVARVIGRAIEHAEADLTLRHRTTHDELTGIPNRMLLHVRLTLALARALRTGTLVGVLVIDLDRFAEVNDTHGHQAGDALLVAVAEQLSAALRGGDTVARVGGDEFALVVESLDAPEAAVDVAERTLQMLRTPSGEAIAATIGVVVCTGRQSAEEAMRDADTALYRAKESGDTRVELFDGAMRAHLVERRQTEADLTGAVTRAEFDLHYQPIVALPDGAVMALEGLIRWRHPTRGMLPPGAFITIAEESGAILEMGRFVIAQACADAARWNALRPDQEPILVTVNLAAAQLEDDGLPAFVAARLRSAGIEARQLGLEITETVVFSEKRAHMDRLLAIRRLGVRLLLDDFGTGYSSLSYLRRFPLDFLKLDRSFVRGVGTDDTDTAIVVAVCELAGAIGLTVVAEGAETGSQVSALAAIGCDLVQGYFFARPLTRAKVDRLAVSEAPWRLDVRRVALGLEAD